jgi:hypothetical protein
VEPPKIKKQGNLIISTASDGTQIYYPQKYYKNGIGFMTSEEAEKAAGMTLEKAKAFFKGEKSFLGGDSAEDALDQNMKEIQRLVDSGGRKNESEAWDLMRALPEETKQAMLSSPRYRKTATTLAVRLGLGAEAINTELNLKKSATPPAPTPGGPEGQTMGKPAVEKPKPDWVQHREKLGIPYTWDAKLKAWVPADGQKISV